jgi:hypothetical protein
MMVWFLKRWNRVSDGLLDAEPDDPAAAASSSSSSTLPSRRDRLVLERADSFELLAPEEQEQVEPDFRATLMDPEERRGHHPTKFEAAVPLLQAQNRCDRYDPGCVAQEMMMIAPSAPPGWPGDAKGKGREDSIDPDDSISQVAQCNDKQSQPGERLADIGR